MILNHVIRTLPDSDDHSDSHRVLLAGPHRAMSAAIHIPVERITTSALGLRLTTGGTLFRGRPSRADIQPRRAFHHLLRRPLPPHMPVQHSWRAFSVASQHSRRLHASSSMHTYSLTHYSSNVSSQYDDTTISRALPLGLGSSYDPVLVVIFLNSWAWQYHPPFQRPQRESHQNDQSQRMRRHSIPRTRMGRGSRRYVVSPHVRHSCTIFSFFSIPSFLSLRSRCLRRLHRLLDLPRYPPT